MLLKSTGLSLLMLLLAGCFQASIHGPVTEATLTVAPLAEPDNILFTTRTGNIEDVKTEIGGKAYGDLGPVLQTLSLGYAELKFGAKANKLYLITVTGGRDADANRDLKQDKSRTAVKGVWHAIATGHQLKQNLNNVTPLTEAVFQIAGTEVAALNSMPAQEALNRVARQVLGEDVNGKDGINYEDVLRWTGVSHGDRLMNGSANTDRLALAIRNDESASVLRALSNRIAGGDASIGLDEAFTLKRSPDGSCGGRGAAMVSSRNESVTVLLPEDACGADDLGQVESSTAKSIAVIEPGQDGLPSSVTVGDVSLTFSDYTLEKAKLKIHYTNGNGPISTKTQAIKALDELDKISTRHNLLQASVSGNSVQYTNEAGALMRYDRRAELSADDFSTSDALAYGTLVASWTACAISDFLDDLGEQGTTLPRELIDWAAAACTSPLVDIESWVAQASRETLMQVEAAVPEVVLEGCASCYAEVSDPEYGQVARVGQPLLFNGIVPANNGGANWRFGDGNGFQGTSTSYSYTEPGEYEAKLIVDHVDGSMVVREVPVLIVPEGGSCLRQPEVDAGPARNMKPGDTVVLTGVGTAFSPPSCVIASYHWEQILGTQVEIVDANKAVATFEAPRLDMPTELGFRLTVEDSNGNSASANTIILVPAAGRCLNPPVVDAGPDREVIVEPGNPALIGLFGDITSDDGSGCILRDFVWTQVDGLSVGSLLTGSDLPLDAPPYSGGFITDIVDTLEFALTARDSDGNESSDRVRIKTLDGENYPKVFSTSYRVQADFRLDPESGYPQIFASCDTRVTLQVVEYSQYNYVTSTTGLTLHGSPTLGLIGCHGDGLPPFDDSTTSTYLYRNPTILSVGPSSGRSVTAIMQGYQKNNFSNDFRTQLQENLVVDGSGINVPLVCQGVEACEGLLPD